MKQLKELIANGVFASLYFLTVMFFEIKGDESKIKYFLCCIMFYHLIKFVYLVNKEYDGKEKD